MGPIEDSLRDAFFPALFGGEEASSNFRDILGHSVKHGGLGIPEYQMLAECANNTSNAAREVLVGSLLGGNNLNDIEHKSCMCRSGAEAQKQQEYSEIEIVTRRKDMADRVVLNRLRWATENGAWLAAIP